MSSKIEPTRFQQALGKLDKALYRWGLRSTRLLRLPNFLGIGAEGSGASWLHGNLRHHPLLFLPEEQDLHYFDRHYHSTLGSYGRHFRDAMGRVAGEISASYSALSPERIAWVHRVLPEAKLIFILRNPVDRAWSRAVAELSPSEIPTRKIAPEDYLSLFRATAPPDGCPSLDDLDRWLAHYPRHRVLVEFFDDITNHPEELLIRVFRFLGVGPVANWDRFPLTQDPPPRDIPETVRALLEDQHREEIVAFQNRFGPRVAGWVV